MGYGASPIFCYRAIPIKLSQSITYFGTAEKVMPYHPPPTALPVGGGLAMPLSCGISPLTCTIFDPTYFGSILRNHVFHISPTRLKSSIMGKLPRLRS